MGDMIQLEDGSWVTRPPEHCANGHPFRPGDIRTYSEAWFGCWCDGAQSRDKRPGHTQYTCKRCDAVTLVPACTDPSLKVGWAASHGG